MTQRFNRKRVAPQVQPNNKKKKSIANTKRSDHNSVQICQGKVISNVDQKVMRPHFQEEIIMDILSRLPVRSLHRFKRVSKFWMALIYDPYFKMQHLNHAKNDENSQKLLLCRKCIPEDDICSFYCSSLSPVQVVEDEQKLDLPSYCKPVTCMLYCCCDGLVLLRVTNKVDRNLLLLWNPSTKESILLPHPESCLTECVCGMGYDAISDDYKILAVNLSASAYHKVSVEILALKSGLWRKISDYPTGIHRVEGVWDCGMDSLAFVNGAFHWLGLSQCYTIVSFNISNELYKEIPVLECMCNILKARYIEHGVSVLRGKLCLYSTDNILGAGTFKLWIMKDYGVKESWTEVLTIQDKNLFDSAKPKYMFADGEVFLSCKHLPRSGPWPQRLTLEQEIIYTESLISPRLLI